MAQLLVDVSVAFEDERMDNYRKVGYVEELWLDGVISRGEMNELRRMIGNGEV